MDFFTQCKLRLTLERIRRRGNPHRRFERALLARLHGRPAAPPFFPWFAWQRLAVPVGVLLLSAVATGTYAYTSPNVAAGHPLYRFKRKFEGYEERLQRTPEQRVGFLARKSARRVEEAVGLLENHQSASSEVFFADAVSELERGIETLNHIPDPVRRRRAVNVIIQSDGTYLVRVQELAAEHPDFVKTLSPKISPAGRDLLRAQIQAVEDPEIRSVLRAHLLAREAMLHSLSSSDDANAAF